jgi:hypothetical protein
MKKDAVYQNAINYHELSATRKGESEVKSALTVVESLYCVPNCVKKHDH